MSQLFSGISELLHLALSRISPSRSLTVQPLGLEPVPRIFHRELTYHDLCFNIKNTKLISYQVNLWSEGKHYRGAVLPIEPLSQLVL